LSTPESSAGSVPPYGTFVRPSTVSVPPVIGALPLMIRPPHLPRVSSIVKPSLSVSVCAVSVLTASGLSAVKVMGEFSVPSAMIFPPCSMTSAGANPAPSAGVAKMVVPGGIVSVAPFFTNVWHVRK
jgi:hypothetical protein